MTVTGPYTVERLLGRGAVALVELARDGQGRPVAIKRVALRGSAEEIDLARIRIRREAELLGRLHHPSVLPLLGLEDDGTDIVLVMPFAAGGSLHDRVRGRGPLSSAEVAQLAGPLLDGLAAVHRHGVVHRDVTPANILFSAFDTPVLADFGVASWRGYTAGLTRDGWAVGTPGFMAPEQARGKPATSASDVFGLAASLVFALRGVGPYGAGSPELLGWRAAQGDVEPLPPGLPAGMAADLRAMLHPDPTRRPSAASVLGGTTGTALLPAVQPTRAPLPPVPAAPVRRRRRWTRVAGSLITAAVAVLAVLLATRGPSGGTDVADPGARPTPVASTPCTDKPYQPCGQSQPAPFTDGTHCVSEHADYDGKSANGCEAAPDTLDGATLVAGRALSANLVPATDSDTYRFYADDHFQLLCDGVVSVRLTTPAGSADRVEVLRDGHVAASAVSADAVTAVARLNDPSCGRDNSGWYSVRVSSISGHSAASYRLEATGHL